jgi:virginiamycin B lyase
MIPEVEIYVTKGKCLLFFMLLSGSVATLQAQKDAVSEYPISEGCCMNGIVTGPDGALWFTAGYVIGRITTSGSQSYYQVPFTPQGAIAVGPDGALWFTGSDLSVGSIGRISMAGKVTVYPTPTVDSFPQGIALGPDGTMWFTESAANNIGRVSTAAASFGTIAEYPIPTPSSYPISIARGTDGALWFTEGSGNQIGRITTAGAITEYTLAGSGLESPNWIATGPDGALWFTELSLPAARIGRITTSGNVTSYVLSPEGATGQITAGPDGALWFAGGSFNSVGRITTAGSVIEYPLPSASSFPTGITAGPDGGLWLVENNAGKVARATACGVGLGLSLANSTLTINFEVGLTTTATWRAWVVSGSGGNRLFSKSVGPLVPPRTTADTLTNFSDPGDVEVFSTLSSATGVLCSNDQILNSAVGQAASAQSGTPQGPN